jgi:hypothetical protein
MGWWSVLCGTSGSRAISLVARVVSSWFKGMSSARRFVDRKNLTKRFTRLVGTSDDYAYGCRSPPCERHYGSSLIHWGMQVKTWSNSLGQTTVGSLLHSLSGDVFFKTSWSFLA